MAITDLGPVGWDLSLDDDGHRTYTITHKLKTTDSLDGPETILNSGLLPVIGSTWAYDNDTDVWAFCTPKRKIKVFGTKSEPAYIWHVTSTFTTIPMERCNDTSIDNPLSEPDRISGGFVKYTREISHNRFGEQIKSSSHEVMRGPLLEFDHNRPTVKIQQNVASLGLSTFAPMIDTVNDATLWGLDARTIKLSNVSWERLLQGVCAFYYSRTFEFDIDYSTFDREILDSGEKCIKGDWNKPLCDTWTPKAGANKDNPLDFQRFQDCKGNIARTLLDGNGAPLDITDTGTGIGDITIDIEYYGESNFLTLGIPASL